MLLWGIRRYCALNQTGLSGVVNRLSSWVSGSLLAIEDCLRLMTTNSHATLFDRPSLCLVTPVAVAVGSCAALFWLAHGGWPGEMGVTAAMFCERFSDGIVKQPVNCFSNLGFILVGLWVGRIAMLDRHAQLLSREPPANRMRASNAAPVLYASLAVLLGPGSMAMHASTTHWGGTLDVMSMYIWVSFAITYGWVRLRNLSAATLYLSYFVLVTILCGLLFIAPWLNINIVFGVLVVVFALIEVAIRRQRPETKSEPRWLFAAAVFFLSAFGIWIPSLTGGPWCDPDSILQGHAAWHLLDAAAVACIFQFYRSEEDLPPDRTRAASEARGQ